MSQDPVFPPGLAAPLATRASPWRNFIVGVAGVVMLLLGAWAVIVLATAARETGGIRPHHTGLILSAGCGTVTGALLLVAAVANAVEGKRIARVVKGELHPGEVIQFAAMAMLPRTAPASSPDVLISWRVGGPRTAILLSTDQRLLLIGTRGATHPTLAWPRERVTDVTTRIQKHRAVLSAEVRGEGRLELWLRGAHALADAQEVLSSSDVPADVRRA